MFSFLYIKKQSFNYSRASPINQLSIFMWTLIYCLASGWSLAYTLSLRQLYGCSAALYNTPCPIKTNRIRIHYANRHHNSTSLRTSYTLSVWKKGKRTSVRQYTYIMYTSTGFFFRTSCVFKRGMLSIYPQRFIPEHWTRRLHERTYIESGKHIKHYLNGYPIHSCSSTLFLRTHIIL